MQNVDHKDYQNSKDWTEKIALVFTIINDSPVSISDIDRLGWIQRFPSANPFGVGGDSVTYYNVYCYRNTVHGDCVLVLLDRLQYREKYYLGMIYEIR